jgi:hypothetical protein
MGGRAHKLPATYDGRWDAVTFAVYTREDWVVLEADLGLMPALAVYLSKDTRSRVACRDHYSTVGYEHFSLLQAGEPIYVFTDWGDYLDLQGINQAEFAARIQAGDFKVSAGDDPAGRDFRYYAPGIFCRFVAPFDLDDFFWESTGSGQPVEYVRLELPCADCAHYRLGGELSLSAFSWDALLHRAGRGISAADQKPKR